MLLCTTTTFISIAWLFNGNEKIQIEERINSAYCEINWNAGNPLASFSIYIFLFILLNVCGIAEDRVKCSWDSEMPATCRAVFVYILCLRIVSQLCRKLPRRQMLNNSVWPFATCLLSIKQSALGVMIYKPRIMCCTALKYKYLFFIFPSNPSHNFILTVYREICKKQQQKSNNKSVSILGVWRPPMYLSVAVHEDSIEGVVTDWLVIQLGHPAHIKINKCSNQSFEFIWMS